MVKLKNPRDEILAKERAERVRGLRDLLGYSRQKFCEKYAPYGVSASTLQSWETVRWNGLSEGGAEILAKIFKEEGLNVTIEFLLFGVGFDPLKGTHAEIKISSEEIITKELQFFHQHNGNTIDAVITDDSLAPWLSVGDRVAGKRLFEDSIKQAVNRPCIIQPLSGEILVRWLKNGQKPEHYTLVCTNPDTQSNNPTLEEVKLFSAAPILWIRKFA